MLTLCDVFLAPLCGGNFESPTYFVPPWLISHINFSLRLPGGDKPREPRRFFLALDPFWVILTSTGSQPRCKNYWCLGRGVFEGDKGTEAPSPWPRPAGGPAPRTEGTGTAPVLEVRGAGPHGPVVPPPLRPLREAAAAAPLPAAAPSPACPDQPQCFRAQGEGHPH